MQKSPFLQNKRAAASEFYMTLEQNRVLALPVLKFKIF
jgi:hypothetical protein